MFKINDITKTLSVIDSDNSETVLHSFIEPDILKDRAYTLYAFVRVINDILYVKFGEAKKQSIYSRYATVTGSKDTDRMIAIWKSDKGDKEIHSKLRIRSNNNRGYSPATKDILNTDEAYEIASEAGLRNLLSDITEYAEADEVVTK